MKFAILAALLALTFAIRLTHEDNPMSGSEYSLGPVIRSRTGNTIKWVKIDGDNFTFQGCRKFTCPFTLNGESFKASTCSKQGSSCDVDSDEVLATALYRVVKVVQEGKSFKFINGKDNL